MKEWHGLGALFRDVMAETIDTDPAIIAKEMRGHITKKHLDVAVSELLEFYVKKQGGNLRRQLGADRQTPKSDSPSLRFETLLKRDTGRVAKLLASRLNVDSQLMFMADMTRPQLLASASTNRMQAAGHLESADRKERLAALLADDSQTVADLSDAEIEKAWWSE